MDVDDGGVGRGEGADIAGDVECVSCSETEGVTPGVEFEVTRDR